MTATISQGDKTPLSDRTRRRFDVTYHLSRSPFFVSDRSIQIDPAPKNGRSFFIVVPPSGAVSLVSLQLQLVGTDQVIDVHWNDRKEISSFVASVQATNHAEALSLAGERIEPWLDYMAYLGDTPVFVAQISYVDTVHHTVGGTYTSPYLDMNFSGGPSDFPLELRPFLALYREGLCATSRYYRFLCWYKVLEGVRKHRSTVHAESKALSVAIQYGKELVPTHPELLKMDVETIGKPIWSLFDGVWNERFRLNIAHFMQSGVDIFLTRKGAAELSNSMLAIQLSCRVVLDNHEKQLRALNKAKLAGGAAK